ncbi:muscular LMNA-interacting protein [Vombatus ursinus]|uniref:muscular LMNA-interacting protein n=1 Tax=Vombatus ursinus TaxID=29139 RepID=UPI000FFDAD89|nr:muscular LMNA-interacting protein [Vombatus ursinus]
MVPKQWLLSENGNNDFQVHQGSLAGSTKTKAQVLSGDSETKPLIFTFVPTIRRLPTHTQVADASKYLVKIGEEPRDKSQETVNRSNSNEFSDHLISKSGIRQESDTRTFVGSPETSQKVFQGRGLKSNQPETMQQSDLFKAEYVFIVDSEGEEEAICRKEDKQPLVGNGQRLARPKSLAIAPGPVSALQKPHHGDFQVPGQPELPHNAANQQKQAQQYKIKSSYKAFAAIPTNTILLEQKALDEPAKSERITKDSTLDSHLEHPSDSPSSSMQTSLGSDGNKMPATLPRAAGRETKYANLASPSSTMAVSQLTKPGVIRPVSVKSKIVLRKEEEETYEPNPFSKYLEENSGLFAGQPSHPIVTIPENEALGFKEQ